MFLLKEILSSVDSKGLHWPLPMLIRKIKWGFFSCKSVTRKWLQSFVLSQTLVHSELTHVLDWISIKMCKYLSCTSLSFSVWENKSTFLHTVKVAAFHYGGLEGIDQDVGSRAAWWMQKAAVSSSAVGALTVSALQSGSGAEMCMDRLWRGL